MKINLFYFSGTGNTKYICELVKESFIEKGINEVQLSEINRINDNFLVEVNDDTLLGFAYPVYDYLPPENILKLAEKIKLNSKNPCFVFNTYTTDPMDSNMHLIDRLKENNIYTIAEGGFKSPGASAFMYANPQLPMVKPATKFENQLNQNIENFVKNIINKYNTSDQNTSFLKVKYNRLNKFHQWFSKITFGNMFYRNLKVDNNCSLCGLCVENCPDKNLTVKDSKLKVSKTNNCQRCLKCVQLCKKRAINFTSQKRRGDYTSQIRKECYSKVC